MKRVFLILFLVFISISIFLSALLPYIRLGAALLGFDHPKEYLVLFQNNMELRATGGFLGSYGRIRITRGIIELEKIEDIYTPDGQIEGHVDAPWPIQAAFGQGWFRLRDSNWDPDFPTSAKTIQWFFEQGKEEKADGFIAVNLSFLEAILKITGPLYVVDEPEHITADNFYKKTQSAVEQNFFPGSVQKKTFLSKLGTSLVLHLKELPLQKKIQIPFLLFDLAQKKEILLYANDNRTQSLIEAVKFDGGLRDIRNSGINYLALFESNLGANKANCCIKRQVSLNLSKKDQEILHELRLHYENTNPATLKQPPQYWGGAYVNFLRIAMPLHANLISIRVGDVEYPIPSKNALEDKESVVNLMKENIDEELRKFIVGDSEHLKTDIHVYDEKGIQMIGFFVLVDALSAKDVRVEYSIADEFIQTKKLYIHRQSGQTEKQFTFLGKEIVLESDVIKAF